MEAITLKAVARELGGTAVPGRVRSVFQLSARDVVISLGARRAPHVVISVHPARPSLFSTSRKLPALAAPTAFCRLLRKRLGGLVLTAVDSPGMERSVELRFGAAAGGEALLTLVVEIMGRWSNILLVESPSGTIVDCLHHVPEGPRGGRVLMPGEDWLPPPSGGRRDLEEVTPGEFAAIVEEAEKGGPSPAARLVGLGPGLLALAGERGGGDLHLGLREVMALVRSGEGKAVYYPARKRVLPLPVTTWGDEGPLFFGTVAEAAEYAFLDIREDEEHRRLTGRHRKVLTRRKGRLQKKRDRLLLEAAEGSEEAEFTATGQALLAVLPRIPRGAGSFTLEETDLPGGRDLTVPLDPALTPRQNAEAFFRKARKARRRAELARRRLPPLEADLAALEKEVEALSGLTLEELRSLGRRPAAPSRGKKAAPPGSSSKIREYRLSGGWRILVGKSSAGNDELTSRAAQPDDTWLHTRDYPGAHVVIKAPGPEKEPPGEVLRAAAEVAAWHSGARSEGKADVSYALRKHVRKVKGQPPGKVIMTRSQTIRVTPRLGSALES